MWRILRRQSRRRGGTSPTLSTLILIQQTRLFGELDDSAFICNIIHCDRAQFTLPEEVVEEVGGSIDRLTLANLVQSRLKYLMNIVGRILHVKMLDIIIRVTTIQTK